MMSLEVSEKGRKYRSDRTSMKGVLTNFSFTSCTSNWVPGRNLDSDGDNIGDACDVFSLCPTDFAKGSKLSVNQTMNQIFATDGLLQSQQVILSPPQVTYNSLIGSELQQGFEVRSGATLLVSTDGCNK